MLGFILCMQLMSFDKYSVMYPSLQCHYTEQYHYPHFPLIYSFSNAQIQVSGLYNFIFSAELPMFLTGQNCGNQIHCLSEEVFIHFQRMCLLATEFWTDFSLNTSNILLRFLARVVCEYESDVILILFLQVRWIPTPYTLCLWVFEV